MDKLPHYLDDNGDEVFVPWRWEICPVCDGHGTDRGASVECDGGGFTGSEWAELDDDFKSDYLGGFYDRPCTECGGSGKVKVADLDNMDPAAVAAYEIYMEDEADFREMSAAERRMGA